MVNTKRSESAKQAFAKSPLAARNKALALAANLEAVPISRPDVGPLVAKNRVTTVLQYCGDDPASHAHINKGREPFLMRADDFDPGFFDFIAIFDRRIEAVEKRSGLCWVDVMQGEVLLKPDTAVCWK